MKSRLLSSRNIETLCLCGGVLLALVLFSQPLPAKLEVEVTQGFEGGVPIAVAPFKGEPQGRKRSLRSIVANDFAYSVLFLVIDTGAASPGGAAREVDYGAWLMRGVEKLILGEVMPDRVRVELHDIVRRRLIKGFSIMTVGTGLTDYTAHQISDVVYEELTGFPGIFTTRIAFVATERYGWRRHHSTLYISDADGHNARAIYTSPYQLMSPTWPPDLERIAYVSYESGRSQIVIQTLATGEREMLGVYTGAASLPSWSHDGRYLAYVGSAAGNPDIYVLELAVKRVTRMTRSNLIDTEPTWAPDGTLIFTSDRSGSPQLYRLDGLDAAPERITFQGAYNSDADVSPSGDRLAFLSQREQQFMIVTKDFTRTDGDETELVSSIGIEGPRFTANGQLLGYITDRNGKSAFGLMTTDGVFGKLIPLPVIDVRGAQWSPLTW